MNEYGQIAMRHWQTHRPSEYAQIPDPENHFASLGQSAQEQATQVEEEIFRSLPPTEDYLAAVAHRNQARATARELVLADLLQAPEGEETARQVSPDLRDELVDPSGMPTDPNHPLWADLEDDSISPAQFQTRRQAWISSLPTR